MAAAAASGVCTEFTLAARTKGEWGNLITARAILSGVTGATTLVESGNACTVILKSSDGTGVTATNAEVLTALNSGRLLTCALQAGITGANTGATFSGAAAAVVALAGGASGANGYDDLAGATGDDWVLTTVAAPDGSTSHVGIDTLTKVISTGPGAGHRVRAVGVAATGATNAVKAAYSEELRRAKMGYPRTLYKVGATGANEYLV